MQKSFLDDSVAAVALPEVQSMIRELGKYGLGVCVPHMHDINTGAFLPLPHDVVQSESGLKVSFVTADEVGPHDIPVAWRWNDRIEVVANCQVCRPDGPHH